MIDIKIWKIIEHKFWNCYSIKDFKIRKSLSEDGNYASYSWSTRHSFLEDKQLSNILKQSNYIRVSSVIDKLREIKLYIPRYWDNKCLWEWFMAYSEESLKRYWDDAYIWHEWICEPNKNI